jgi:hypothetical protein
MPETAPSALVTEKGQRVLFRIRGRLFDLPQEELRALLGLPSGPPGLGITIDRDHFHFEFAKDGETMKISTKQLHRRLSKRQTAQT